MHLHIVFIVLIATILLIRPVVTCNLQLKPSLISSLHSPATSHLFRYQSVETAQSKCPYEMYPYPIPSGPGLDSVLANLTALFDSQFQTTAAAASAVLTYRENILWYWNGGMDNRTKQKPTADSVYRIGSVTKTFAWLLAMIAESKGLINMDDPVVKSVPDLKMLDPFHQSTSSGLQSSFTWNQLASHLAGVPRESPCPFGRCTFNTDQMLKRLENVRLKLPTETRPSYSNLGFALLGRLVADRVFTKNSRISEHHTQENAQAMPSFEDLVHRLILDPLGMSRSSFTPPADLVPPMTPQSLVNMEWSAPAGQMFSSANDLAKLVLYLNRASFPHYLFSNPYDPFLLSQKRTTPTKSRLSSGNPDPNPLGIPTDRIRRTMFPRFSNPDKTGFSTPWEFTRALDHYYVRNKAGNIDGYSADVAMIPELQLGLSIVTNLGTDGAQWATGNLNAMLPGFLKLLQPLQAMPSPPTNTSRYTGRYSYDTVIAVDFLGMLKIVEMGGNPYSIPLVPTSFDPSNINLLQIYVPEMSLACLMGEELALAYEIVEFTTDEAGNVLSFSIPGFIYGLSFSKLY